MHRVIYEIQPTSLWCSWDSPCASKILERLKTIEQAGPKSESFVLNIPLEAQILELEYQLIDLETEISHINQKEDPETLKDYLVKRDSWVQEIRQKREQLRALGKKTEEN